MSSLDISVRNFGYKDYESYLKSEYWSSFKKRYKEAGKLQSCLVCGNKKYNLHHVTYERICREEIDDVIPLCSECHKKEHSKPMKDRINFSNKPNPVKKKKKKKLFRRAKNKPNPCNKPKVKKVCIQCNQVVKSLITNQRCVNCLNYKLGTAK